MTCMSSNLYNKMRKVVSKKNLATRREEGEKNLKKRKVVNNYIIRSITQLIKYIYNRPLRVVSHVSKTTGSSLMYNASVGFLCIVSCGFG